MPRPIQVEHITLLNTIELSIPLGAMNRATQASIFLGLFNLIVRDQDESRPMIGPNEEFYFYGLLEYVENYGEKE